MHIKIEQKIDLSHNPNQNSRPGFDRDPFRSVPTNPAPETSRPSVRLTQNRFGVNR